MSDKNNFVVCRRIANKIDYTLIALSIVTILCCSLSGGITFIKSGDSSQLTNYTMYIVCILVVTVWLIIFTEVVSRMVGRFLTGKCGGSDGE